MTDRQAKELTLRDARRTVVIMDNLAERMREVSQHFIFENITPDTLERLKAQMQPVFDSFQPRVRVVNLNVVHDSVTFELDYER